MALVELTSHGTVRELTLSAPERRNALDRAMLTEFRAAVADVAADGEARALVISGAGKAFCAGADLKGLFGDVTRPAAEIREDLKWVYGSFLGLLDLRIPTIAAVQGAAVGAGANIALVCDQAIAGPRAKMGFTFAEIGLHPGGGCSWFLTRRMGPQKALAVILAGQTLDAETALRYGVVDELVEDPLARAFELSQLYASRDAAVVRDMKRAVQLSVSADLATVVDFESWAQASAVGKPAFAEFMSTFGSPTTK